MAYFDYILHTYTCQHSLTTGMRNPLLYFFDKLLFSDMKIPRVHIKVVFGCLAGFVITFAVFEYGWLTGTRVRKTLSLPMSFENITHLTRTRSSTITPVLTQVDLERIQQIIQLAQPKDDHYHHGKIHVDLE